MGHSEKRTRGPVWLILALTAVTSVATAQERQGRILSWMDCVNLAGRKNPDLVSSRKSLEASAARYHGSFNTLFPRLSISNRYSDSDSGAGSSRWQADGTVSMDLFNMKSFARVSSASAARRRAEADLRLKSADLRLNLRRAFADLLFAQEQVAVSESIRDLRRQNADLVSLKYDSGRESKGNTLRARAELVEAQAFLAQAVRNLRVARQELGRHIGLDDFEMVVASGALTARSLPDPPEVARLAGGHPAVLQREAARMLAQAGLQESRSTLWPSLAASYSRNLRGADYFPSEPGWNVSGVVSLPVFGAGPTATYYDVSAARRDLERAEEDLRAARNQVKSDLESSWANLADKIDQMEVQRRFLEAARQRNEESSVRYASGLMSFENWELVVADVVNFERGSLRARRDTSQAEAEWNKALGLGVEE